MSILFFRFFKFFLKIFAWGVGVQSGGLQKPPNDSFLARPILSPKPNAWSSDLTGRRISLESYMGTSGNSGRTEGSLTVGSRF
jgi:hypothetical protein